MALEKCAECKSEISTSAKICPKCGAPQRRTSGFTKIVGTALAAIVVIMVVNSARSRDEQERAAAAEATRVAKMTPEQRAAEQRRRDTAAAAQKLADYKANAPYACKELVTKRLKDPDSAKWESPWYSETKVSKDGSQYDVQVQVRAKNGFGAYDLSNFDCTLARRGDTFSAIRIREVR